MGKRCCFQRKERKKKRNKEVNSKLTEPWLFKIQKRKKPNANESSKKMVLKGNVIEHSEEEIEEIEGNLEFTLSSCYIVHLNALLYPTICIIVLFFFFFFWQMTDYGLVVIQ